MVPLDFGYVGNLRTWPVEIGRIVGCAAVMRFAFALACMLTAVVGQDFLVDALLILCCGLGRVVLVFARLGCAVAAAATFGCIRFCGIGRACRGAR